MAEEKRYSAKQAALAVLEKVGKLLKGSELVKAETGHEKGIHTATDPGSTNKANMGYSAAGAASRMTTWSKKNPTKTSSAEWKGKAVGEHVKTLKEMSQMPSPNLGKGEEEVEDRDQTIRRLQKSGFSPNQIESELAKRETGHEKGVHTAQPTYFGPGTSTAGAHLRNAGMTQGKAKATNKGKAKDMVADKIMENRLLPTPKLGKSELENDLEGLEVLLKGEPTFKPKAGRYEDTGPKGIHASSTRGLDEHRGVSDVGHNVRVHNSKGTGLGAAKDMVADKIMENRMLPSPKLGKDESGEAEAGPDAEMDKSELSEKVGGIKGDKAPHPQTTLHHTQSGKAVAMMSPMHHSGFTPEDHKDAANFHSEQKDYHSKMGEKHKGQPRSYVHNDLYNKHHVAASYHHALADGLKKSELEADFEGLSALLKGEGFKPQNEKKENAKPSEHGSKDASQPATGAAPKGEIHPKEKEQAPADGTQTTPNPLTNPKEKAEGNNELAGTTPTQVGQDGKNLPGFDEMKGHYKLAKFIGMMHGKRMAKSSMAPQAAPAAPATLTNAAPAPQAKQGGTGVKLPQ